MFQITVTGDSFAELKRKILHAFSDDKQLELSLDRTVSVSERAAENAQATLAEAEVEKKPARRAKAKSNGAKDHAPEPTGEMAHVENVLPSPRVDRELVRAKGRELCAMPGKGVDALMGVIGKFGVKRAADIPEEKLGEYFEALQAEIGQ